MRIGILGGSFDPIHQGHAALAASAIRELKLDRLLLVPARISPFKTNLLPAPARHRLRMTQLAARRIPKARVCRVELNAQKISYTVDTVLKLQKRFCKSELFLVLGGDAWNSFGQWKNCKQILNLCSVAVGQRRGVQIKRNGKNKIIFLKSAHPEVSSIKIREALARGKKQILGLAPDVLRYIRQRHLYE